MTIIKWILAAIFALLALSQVAAGNLIGFVLLAIACALLLPPLESAISSSVAFLKSAPLRIFLSVILAIVGLSFGGANVVSFTDVAICSADGGAACSSDKPFFLEGQNPVTITATAKEGTGADVGEMRAEILYVPAPGIEEIPVFNDFLETDINGDEVSITVPDLDLQVGTYNISVLPIVDGDEEPLSREAAFTVWPSQAEIDARVATDVGSTDFADTISENFVCVYDGEEIPDTGEVVEAPSSQLRNCDATEPLPSSKVPIVFDYGFADPLGSGASLTYYLRYFPEGEEAVDIYTETTELKEGLDRYGSLDELTEEVPAGAYEMISVLNEPNAKPVRLQFEVLE